MQQLNLSDVSHYVEQNIGTFHQQKLDGIKALNLSDVLKRKNPYLFRAKNVLTAAEIVNGIVNAHVSSNEETIFGDWLEGVAIYICGLVYGGYKSGIKGIDLEFDKDNRRHIVTIKSGPNWGNSGQVAKMVLDFGTAKRALRTSNSNLNVVAINGCCYGKDDNPDKPGEYFKLCGQRFWEFISNDPNLYTQLIVPLGHEAQRKNDEFNEAYAAIINKFTDEFFNEYCKTPGKENSIDWDKLLKLNSGKDDTPKKKAAPRRK